MTLTIEEVIGLLPKEEQAEIEHRSQKMIAEYMNDFKRNGNLVLDANQWEAFQIALDAKPRSLSRLKRLLKEDGVFD